MDSTCETLSGAGGVSAPPTYARFLRSSTENASNLRLVGGAGGIRTLSTDCPVSKMSGQMRDTILLVGALIAYIGAESAAVRFDPRELCRQPGSWYRNARCADHPTSIDLRRTPDR